MGCGSSTEEKKTQAPKAAAVAKGPSAALAHEKAYLGDVRSISSAEYVLFAEMDARTASAFENADEPSDTSLALKRAVIVSRGKLKFGVNEDPDQYDASTDIPEFKQRDKKRVSEWVKAVALANPDGADSIPTSSFYLPDTRGGDSSHSSGGGRHPLEETTTSSGGVDIQLNKMDSFISQRTDQPDAWSNGGGGGGGGGKGKLYRSDADPLHCEDIDEARPVH